MKHRLELFSDAVIAIIITIMVLDLHTPATGAWHALVPILPAVGIYAVGFFTVALSWLSHHRYFAKMETFNRGMVWSNFLYLFCVSLVPLLVRYLADNPHAAAAAVVFILGGVFQVIALSLIRLFSYRDNMDQPGFRQWFESCNRRALFSYTAMLATAGLAWVWPRVGLGVYVMYLLWAASY